MQEQQKKKKKQESMPGDVFSSLRNHLVPFGSSLLATAPQPPIRYLEVGAS